MEGNSHNMTNHRVTETGGKLLYKDGRPLHQEFNACLQNESLRLAKLNYKYHQILTDPNIGVYSVARCGFARLPNLSINDGYPFRPSMTNGTSPRWYAGSSQTDEVTPVNAARQAERYWGYIGIDAVISRPFGQSGTYMAGSHRGDKGEYLMEFGGWYENLHLIGISDRLGPVRLNIYIDGYFHGSRQWDEWDAQEGKYVTIPFSMQWEENDNRRHLRVDKFPNIPKGVHAIAIEFVHDYCFCDPHHYNTDRNFYIDVLGVNGGPIHRTVSGQTSFLLQDHSLYLPLMLK